MSPSVTVVVPSYRHAAFVRQRIESIVAGEGAVSAIASPISSRLRRKPRRRRASARSCHAEAERAAWRERSATSGRRASSSFGRRAMGSNRGLSGFIGFRSPLRKPHDSFPRPAGVAS